MNVTRRGFLREIAMAGAAGLVGVRVETVGAERPRSEAISLLAEG